VGRIAKIKNGSDFLRPYFLIRMQNPVDTGGGIAKLRASEMGQT